MKWSSKAVVSWVLVVAAVAGTDVSDLSAAPTRSKKTSVEKLAVEAQLAYKSADYARAIDRLERAYALEPAPTLVYNQAKAFEKWGRLEEALATYERFLSLDEVEPRLRAQAESRVRVLSGEAQRRGAEKDPGLAAVPPPPPEPARPAAAPVKAAPPLELPNNPKAGVFLFHLGKAYERLGQNQKAAQHYIRFLAAPDADPKLRAQAEERLRAVTAALGSSGGAAPPKGN